MPSVSFADRPHPGTGRKSSASVLCQPCGCPVGALHDCNEFPLSPAARAYLTGFDAYLRGETSAVREDGSIIHGTPEQILRVVGVDLIGDLHPCSPDYRPACKHGWSGPANSRPCNCRD